MFSHLIHRERGICFSRASRKIVHWTIFSLSANTQTRVCWLLIQIPLSFFATKKDHQVMVSFCWRRKRERIYAFATMDLPISACPSFDVSPQRTKPKLFLRHGKRTPNMVSFIVAEKEGFEPSLRLSHTTPLAGEPLRPLGYFSEYLILYI